MILTEILDAAAISYQTSKTKGDEVTFDCPFCTLRGLTADTKQKFGLNVKNGLGHCFRCNWASRSLLNTARCLAKVYGLEAELTRLNIHPVRKPKPVEKSEEPKVKPPGLPEGYEAFSDSTDPIERAAKGYLYGRGVSILQIVRHKIGYAAVGPMAWRVLFPVFDEKGRIFGCVGRAIVPDMEPKYLNSSGCKLLWNAHREGQLAVVCEGIMDALRVEKALLQGRDAVAIARLGSTITPTQISQLRKYEKVIVLPDLDVPGAKGAGSMAERCAAAGIIVSVAVPEEMNGKDPGSMSESEIFDYIRSAQPWSRSTGRRLRAAAVKERAVF